MIYGKSIDNLWIYLVSGFFAYPSEKYEFVNWDDDIFQFFVMKNVPNHQPVLVIKVIWVYLPSGKRLQRTMENHGRSKCFMEKLTIQAIFQ